jgi:predicted nucleic acid-binding protein
MPRLIAAHARAVDLTLVTKNAAEFERVSDLALEKWTSLAPKVDRPTPPLGV